MRAAVLRQPKTKLQIEERPVPQPGPGEVLLRVRACGVCHGDLMVQHGEFPFVQYPIVPGHEVAGVVEAVGDRVEHLRAGDRVGAPWLYSSCGSCKQCTHGKENLCGQGQYAGMTRDGGFQEFMIARADYVVPLPALLDFAEATPVMCAGLTVYSGLVHAGFKAGDKVAVVGLGGLGAFAVLFVRAMGGQVAVISSSREKETQARAWGADVFIHSGAEPVGPRLAAWDGGAEIILIAAPAPEAANSALSGLAPDGTVVLLAPVPIAVDSFALTLRRQRLMGSPSGSRKELGDALQIAASHGIRVERKCFALEQAADALAELENTRPAGRLVLMMDS